MREIVSAAMIAVAVCVTCPAGAAPPTAEEKGQAETLFREGRALMNAGKYADACAKLAESQRLDPQLGTQLNIALCHAGEGKTASAWAEFREVAELSEKEHDRERAQFARQQAAQLEKKLPRFTFRVASPPEGIVVRLDGAAIGASAWSSALPVDPGDHVVEATAPGKKPHKGTAHAVAATTVEVAIPALDDEPQAALAPPPPAAAPPPPPIVEAPPPRAEPPVLGYVIGGVGVVGLAVGTIFGIETFAKKSAADDKCGNGVCSPEGHDLETQARTFSIVSTIGFGIGIAGVAAGAYLVLTSKPKGPVSAVRIRPRVGGMGVDVVF